MKQNIFLLAVLSIIVLTACKKEKDASPETAPTVISANGEIQTAIDQFRSLLGPLNNGPATTSGRREINWDAVPEDQLGKPLPENFFNPTGPAAVAGRQRGLVYTPKGGSFAVSKLGFADLNPALKTGFQAFSGTNTFANISASLWEVGFQVPGENSFATVQGFGAVFSGIDQANSSFLEFFDGTESLGKYFIPVRDQRSSFSFLGVYFAGGQRISRVAVSHKGTLVSGKPDIGDGGPADLFVLDDFIYAEPRREQ